jgi:hypothetical protein
MLRGTTRWNTGQLITMWDGVTDYREDETSSTHNFTIDPNATRISLDA